MPPLKVKDSRTGRVSVIDWKDPTRKPTRFEIERLIEEEQGRRPMFAGMTHDIKPPARMSAPSRGVPSFQSRWSTEPEEEGPGITSRIFGTMWGTENSVLPAVPGVTRPILPEMSTDKSLGSMQADAGRWIYNNMVAPSSSAVGLASDWATGKVLGAAGKAAYPYVQPALGRIAPSIFGKSAPAAAPAQKLLPEVAESAPRNNRINAGQVPVGSDPRFVVGAQGTAVDTTRPVSILDIGRSVGGPDPRKVSRTTIPLAKDTGRPLPYRDPATGRMVSRVPEWEAEQALPTTYLKHELPDVDLPVDIQAAYSRTVSAPPPSTRNLGGPVLPDESYLRGGSRMVDAEDAVRTGETVRANQRWPRHPNQEAYDIVDPNTGTVPRARGQHPTSERVGVPDARRIGETREQYRIRRFLDESGNPRTSEWPRKGTRMAGETERAFQKRLAKENSIAQTIKTLEKSGATDAETKGVISELKRVLGNFVRDESGEATIPKILQTPSGTKTVFPEKLAPATFRNAPGRQRIKAEVIDALNAPRAIMASVDLSAPLRQGAGMVHKGAFWKALPKMIKAFGSEDFFKASQAALEARPNVARYKKAGLAISDLSNAMRSEELFMSRAAERIPILGRPIRASGRAYVTFLNHLRADVFDQVTKKAAKNGVQVNDQSLARMINTSTGRGSLGKMERHAPLGNALFFSPRLIKSRIDMLVNPFYYAKLDKTSRIEALKSLAAVTGTVSSVLTLASLNDDMEVELDPRSSDFAKIRQGNVRLDLAAGFQQYIRAFSQIASSSRKDLETKQLEDLGSEYGETSHWDVAERLFSSKLSPIPSFIKTMMQGRTFTGEEAKALPDVENLVDDVKRGDYESALDNLSESEIVRRLTPMIAQDMYELYKEDPELMWMAIPAAFGGAVQVHKHRATKMQRRGPRRAR